MPNYIDNKVFEKTISIFQCAKRDQVKYLLMIEDIGSTLDRLKNRNVKMETKKKWSSLLKDKKQEYNKIIEDYTNSKEQLSQAFASLAENLARYKKFANLDVDDAIQEGVLICFERIDKFDPVKGLAFNYMTTCVLNHFRQLYRSAKHYSDLKSRYLEYVQHQVYDSLLNGSKGRVGYAPGQKNKYKDF